MGAKFTQIPAGTFEHLQINAGILVDEFTPSTETVGNLLGATSGGISFADNITYTDFGDDIDNCPKNTKELKQIDGREITLSGTMVTVTTARAKQFIAAADIDGTDTSKIVPRDTLKNSDFDDVWWIGDYSDINTGASAGFIAIKLKDALNTGGFQLSTSDKGKGQFAFNFMAHYSIENPDTVPYEMYIKAGVATL